MRSKLQAMGICDRLQDVVECDGYTGLRAVMITSILHPAPSCTTTKCRCLPSPALLESMLLFFEKVTKSGRAFNLTWDVDEALHPLVKMTSSYVLDKTIAVPEEGGSSLAFLSSFPYPMGVFFTSQVLYSSLERVLAQHRHNIYAVQLTTSILWETTRILEGQRKGLIEQFLVDRQMSDFELHLRRIKQSTQDEQTLKNCGRILMCLEDGRRFYSFCMVTHKRLGSESMWHGLPRDILPLVLKYL